MRRWTLFSRMVGAPGVAEPVVDVERGGPIPARFEQVEVVALSEVREARDRILRELTELQESYERSRDHWKQKERQDLADQSSAMALGTREARAHVDLAFDAALPGPAHTEDKGEGRGA